MPENHDVFCRASSFVCILLLCNGDWLRVRADGSNIVIETGDSYAPFNTSNNGTAIGIQIYSKMLLFS